MMGELKKRYRTHLSESESHTVNGKKGEEPDKRGERKAKEVRVLVSQKEEERDSERGS